MWLAVITASTLVVFFVAFIIYDARSTESDLNDQADRIMSFSEQSLSSAMWQYNHEYVTDYIDSLFLYKDIVFAQGTIEAQVIKKRTRDGYKHIDFTGDVDSEKYIIRKCDIVYKQHLVGSFIFAMCKERIDQQVLRNTIAACSLLLLLAAIISLTMFILFRKNVMNPLIDLGNSARQIASGDLNARINTSSEDEIGQLAKTFSQMMQSIKSITTSRDDLNHEVNERKKTEKALIQERDKLQKALSEIKTLRGFLPICSYCKKIRDDKGYWNQIESYIHKHSDAEFSHSICPKCAKKYYPEFYKGD